MASKDTALVGIQKLLEHIGEDPTRDGLLDTPDRVLRMFEEVTVGYKQDPEEILSTMFEQDYDELVVLKDIRFSSMCEHHLVNYSGFATVGYLPNKKVVGISKLARLVDCFAKRLTIQERITQQVSQSLMKYLSCSGAACMMTATHNCMACRGVLKPEAEMVTSCLLGAFRDDAKLRAEFFALARD